MSKIINSMKEKAEQYNNLKKELTAEFESKLVSAHVDIQENKISIGGQTESEFIPAGEGDENFFVEMSISQAEDVFVCLQRIFGSES